MTDAVATSRVGWKRNHYVEAAVLAVVLTGLPYLFGLIPEVNWLEIFAVATSYACTWLCVVERRVNFVLGAMSTAAYTFLFVYSGLFASAFLNAYLFPTLIYGWFVWGRVKHVSRVSLRVLPWYLLAAGGAYGIAVLVVSLMGGQMVWADSVILVGSILAQFLLVNKIITTWFVWALVNVFAMYVYFSSGLYLVGVQYMLFFVNTFIGYFHWKRNYGQDA